MRALVLILLAVASFVAAAWHLSDWASLARIGHGSTLFEDFVFVWLPSARGLVSEAQRLPAEGFYSTPSFLLVVTAFDWLGDASTWAWGASIALATLAVAVLPGLCRTHRGVTYEHVALLAVAVAPWHNFKWGQVSALVAALLLLHVALLERRRGPWSALCLALAITIKLHCAAFLLVHLLRRRWRMAAGVLACAFFVSTVVPALLLGPGVVVEVWEHTIARIVALSPRIADDADSQFLPHVVLRYLDAGMRLFGGPTHADGLGQTARTAVVWIGRVACLGLVAGCLVKLSSPCSPGRAASGKRADLRACLA